MNNKQQFAILLFVILALGFAGGFFVGKSTKECPVIVERTLEADTSFNYVPITGGAGSPLTVITKPKNEPIKKITEPVSEVSEPVQQDTTCQNLATFKGVDTLRFKGQDSLFVAISELGNCNGVFYRESILGGKIKERTITNAITNVIEKPAPLLQLNGGVQTTFSNKWKAVDFGPAIQLSFKQKYSFGYSYLMATQTHNFSLLSRLK